MRYKTTILQKHIDLIINHGLSINSALNTNIVCGFLGGHHKGFQNMIKGVFPIKKVYPDCAYTSEDEMRGIQYFRSRNMMIQGLYVCEFAYYRKKIVDLFKNHRAVMILVHINLSDDNPIITSPMGNLTILQDLSKASNNDENLDTPFEESDYLADINTILSGKMIDYTQKNQSNHPSSFQILV
ncbi:hypothetical protein DID74_02420 [Candidatus Marinamargulisbacteria bacterium SCGC AG-333-B06]|nr:hypothetical protein DID74_02420 [Candidatus Marinamargulisbacteria bacterium SCGC AG-333-B06]